MSKAYADGQEGRIDGYNDDMAAYKKQLDQNRRIMSDPLDFKLRHQLGSIIDEIVASGEILDRSEYIQKLGQVFTDAGYITPEQRDKLQSLVNQMADLANDAFHLPAIQYIKPNKAMTRAQNLMTGPEFYERFIHEALHFSDEDMADRVRLGLAYREAARRAANIEDKEQA